MKIAVFTDIYAPWGSGGIATSILSQKLELEKLGHEVTVFCPGFDAKEEGVVTVPSHPLLKISGAVLAKRPSVIEAYILEKFPNFAEFDVVHVHYEASCSIAGIRLAKRFNLPLVQTMHGREDMAIAVNVAHPMKFLTAEGLNLLHGRYLPHRTKVKRDKFQAPTLARARMWNLMVNHAEQADVVVTPSDHFARKLEHYGLSRPVVVVSNGIPKELIGEEFAVRTMKDGDVLKMVWNSRLSKEKRVEPFFQALRMLKRPYMIYVYGNGNMLEWAKRYTKKHGLKVKFYGAVKRPKIIERMREVHLGVTVSYNFDVQAMTLLEAEATGLPVFFCDPVMREIVPQGGYIMADGPEAAAMALTLDSLNADDIEKMSKVMLKNRRAVLQDTQITALMSAYKLAKKQHLLKQNGGAGSL